MSLILSILTTEMFLFVSNYATSTMFVCLFISSLTWDTQSERQYK